ncbi:Biotin/lipoate A/B protein ligase [Phlyctochytrium bullatum]|nr:Biotin/lipoate A/B protein ligase [Phlyctochytrium bullatum]
MLARTSFTRRQCRRRRALSSSTSTTTSTTRTGGEEEPLKYKHKLAIYHSLCTDPWLNLAFEEWLFRLPPSESAHHLALFYRNTPSVIIGRNQNPFREASLPHLLSHSIPLLRRRSGGGTVFHDLGNTNFSFHMPRSLFSRTVHLPVVVAALGDLDVPARATPRHDVVDNGGRKLTGSAYRVAGARAYHHGTVLVDTAPEALWGALGKTGVSSRVTGRGVESVRATVGRVRDHSLTATHDQLWAALGRRFAALWGDSPGDGWDVEDPVGAHPVEREALTVVTEEELCGIPGVMEEAAALRAWDWTYGQTPSFTAVLGGDSSDEDRAVSARFGSKLAVVVEVEEGRCVRWRPAGPGDVEGAGAMAPRAVKAFGRVFEACLEGRGFGEVGGLPETEEREGVLEPGEVWEGWGRDEEVVWEWTRWWVVEQGGRA